MRKNLPKHMENDQNSIKNHQKQLADDVRLMLELNEAFRKEEHRKMNRRFFEHKTP